MTIIPLSEGSFTVDRTKQFKPFNKASDELQDRPVGSLLVEVQPFAVVTGQDILLLDTGLGFSNATGTLQVHENLQKNGIQPNEITKVLLSHLHKDHSGGISMEEKISGKRELSFPNATYYLNKDEFDFALRNGNPSFNVEDFSLLRDEKKIVFTEGEGLIDGYIHYEVSGGHSPFHQVFTINKANEIFFYGGDVAPQLQQMKNRFIAKYDHDGKKSMELRQEWWNEGKQEHWTILFYHDIKTPYITL